MKISAFEVASRLKTWDNIMIICHMNPDGDTLGSAFALYNALKGMGKTVKVDCSDDFPLRFDYLYLDYDDVEFKEEHVIAVDVAALQLFGEKLKLYGDKVDICIDHHPSNEMYAKETYLDSSASAACELIYEVITELNVPITKQIANCLYTGIATDTGCFKYSNTTANTHIIAATLFKYGTDYEEINRYLFDTKTKSRLKVEQQVLNTVEFFYGDKVAMIMINKQMIKDSEIDESELDGLSALPRSIEGVKIGITVRQREENVFKVSMRTNSDVDACVICKEFGGGGHKRAAGCVINGDETMVKNKIIEVIGKFIC